MPVTGTEPATGERVLLAIDTATTRVVIAIGSPAGDLAGTTAWVAGYRHGETLLPTLAAFLADRGLGRGDLAGIVVGTGPGAFTGLRVGLATAKGLAHAARIPLVGVSTAEALLRAAGGQTRGAAGVPIRVVLLPAGPSDRVVVRRGEAPRLLPGGTEPDAAVDEVVMAVDLDGRAPADAVARGEVAREGLGGALLRLGAARLQAHPEGELATVVPEYVTLPRGVRAATGTVAWSRDPR